MAEAETPKKRQFPKRYKEFAKRLKDSCDDSGIVPDLNRGRYVWFVDTFKRLYKINITMEGVRKWFSGEAMPKQDRLQIISDLLRVDVGWLAFGEDDGDANRSGLNIFVSEKASATIIAGFVQLAGGTCGLVSETDANSFADLYATVAGKTVAVSASLGELVDGELVLHVTNHYKKCMVIAVVPTSLVSVDMLFIPARFIETHSTTKGPYVELVARREGRHWCVGTDRISCIVNMRDAILQFANRL